MRAYLQKDILSKVAIVVIFISICSVTFHKKHWEKPNGVIASDVKGYYGYLPALFIYDDIELSDIQSYVIDDDLKIWFSTTENGQNFIKFPSGMAIMYSPFFAIAHMQASYGTAPANGYSWPYRFWLTLGSLFYTFLGIFFIRRLLRLFFDDRVTATTLIVLFLSSNLFYYTAYDGILSHNYSFAVISGFLYGVVKWLDQPKWKYLILTAVCGGLMIAVRHIDILFLPFVFLFGVSSLRALKERFNFLWKYRWMTLTAALIMLLMLTPQLAYYKYIFGTFFHYGYSGERFFFGAPHLYDSLLSYRNGWLVYSPIMILAIVGVFFIRKAAASFFSFAVFSIPVYYYVLASWWCWWFVGFGNRGYINLYPILAIAIASLLQVLYKRRIWYSIPVHAMIIGGFVFTTFQTYQFSEGIIHWTGMTKEGYWDAFGRAERTQHQYILVAEPDIEAAKRGEDFVFATKMDTLSVGVVTFDQRSLPDNSVVAIRSKKSAFSGSYGVNVSKEHTPLAVIPVQKGTTHIFVSAWIKGGSDQAIEVWTDELKPFYHFSTEIAQTKRGWRQVHIVATPFPDVDYKQMNISLWNRTKETCSVDQIKYICMKARTVRKPY